MNALSVLLLVAAAAADAPDSIARGHRLGEHTQPADPRPSRGHGIDAEQARAGWISLFDGATTFGWRDGATVAGGAVSGGRTTTRWQGKLRVRASVAMPGRLNVGRESIVLKSGRVDQELMIAGRSALELADGAAVTELTILPQVPPLKNADWISIGHPRLPAAKQTRWTFDAGRIHGIGGPGCVELQGRAFGDFILQAEVTARGPLTNGGIFFRAVPGDFMNGYEAQVFNGCLEQDATKPSKWSTGAIDDRQNARRVVSRDGTPFRYTILADGSHLAVWINGFQQVDWTDDRLEDDNARKGRRTKPGALQLQAHDAETDIEFADIRIAPLE